MNFVNIDGQLINLDNVTEVYWQGHLSTTKPTDPPALILETTKSNEFESGAIYLDTSKQAGVQAFYDWLKSACIATFVPPPPQKFHVGDTVNRWQGDTILGTQKVLGAIYDKDDGGWSYKLENVPMLWREFGLTLVKPYAPTESTGEGEPSRPAPKFAVGDIVRCGAWKDTGPITERHYRPHFLEWVYTIEGSTAWRGEDWLTRVNDGFSITQALNTETPATPSPAPSTPEPENPLTYADGQEVRRDDVVKNPVGNRFEVVKILGESILVFEQHHDHENNQEWHGKPQWVNPKYHALIRRANQPTTYTGEL